MIELILEWCCVDSDLCKASWASDPLLKRASTPVCTCKKRTACSLHHFPPHKLRWYPQYRVQPWLTEPAANPFPETRNNTQFPIQSSCLVPRFSKPWTLPNPLQSTALQSGSWHLIPEPSLWNLGGSRNALPELTSPVPQKPAVS